MLNIDANNPDAVTLFSQETSATEIMTELGALWMEFVGSDHHKDRDCHFTISQEFSYGDPPYWTASHCGYVDDGFGWSRYPADEKGLGERRFRTYGAALIHCVEQTLDMFRRHAKALPAPTVERLTEISAYWKDRAYASDSNSDPEGGDRRAPCEASQSGGEAASPKRESDHA